MPLQGLPDELMAHILTLLSVKQVMQLRCINKYFKNFISNPYFVQIHLNKSARTPHPAIISRQNNWKDRDSRSVVTLPIPRLLSNKFTAFHGDPCYRLNDNVHIHQVHMPHRVLLEEEVQVNLKRREHAMDFIQFRLQTGGRDPSDADVLEHLNLQNRSDAFEYDWVDKK
ncbi:hypothetical protein RYX36_011361 [Vicia faba]